MKKTKIFIAFFLAAFLALGVLSLSSCTRMREDSPYVFLDEIIEKEKNKLSRNIALPDANPEEVKIDLSWDRYRPHDNPMPFDYLTLTSRKTGDTTLRTLSIQDRSGLYYKFNAELWSTEEKHLLRTSAYPDAVGMPKDAVSDFPAWQEWVNRPGLFTSLVDGSRTAALKKALSDFLDESASLFRQYATATLTRNEGTVYLTFTLSEENAAAFLNKLAKSVRSDQALFEALLPFLLLSPSEKTPSTGDLQKDFDRFFSEKIAALIPQGASMEIILTTSQRRDFRGADIRITETKDGAAKTKTLSFCPGRLGGFDLTLTAPDELPRRLSHRVVLSGRNPSGKLTLSVGEHTSTLIAWDYDQRSGAFGLDLAIPDGITAKFSGFLTITDNEFVLTVKQIRIAKPTKDSTQTTPKFVLSPLCFRITLIQHSTTPLPEPPADYVNFTEMSRKERENFRYRVEYDTTIYSMRRYFDLLSTNGSPFSGRSLCQSPATDAVFFENLSPQVFMAVNDRIEKISPFPASVGQDRM